MQDTSDPSRTNDYYPVESSDVWYGGAAGVLPLIVADRNPGSASLGLPPRLNPMAAGTLISASTPTTGLTVPLGGGTPVASTTEATGTAVAYTFTDPAVLSGIVFVSFESPSGLISTVTIPVSRETKPSSCPQ